MSTGDDTTAPHTAVAASAHHLEHLGYAMEPLARHMEFLGYAIESTDDECYIARHPYHWNSVFYESPSGLVLVSVVSLGLAARLRRREWLEFLNERNNELRLACAAFREDADGDCVLHVHRGALLPRTYDRVHFGRLLDCWHRDLDALRNGPSVEAVTVPESDAVN